MDLGISGKVALVMGASATNNAGFRLAREINAQKAFDRFRGAEVDPGPEIDDGSAPDR